MNAPKTKTPARPGFTLIEIMVAITIIAILIAIAVPQIGGVINKSRATATRATITKVHGLLQERLDAYARFAETELSKAWRERVNQRGPIIAAINGPAHPDWRDLPARLRTGTFPQGIRQVFIDNNVPINNVQLNELAKSIWLKEMYLEKFAPLFSLNGDVLNQTKYKFLDDISDPQLHKSNTESAEILFYILTEAEVFGVGPVATSDFSTSEVADTDGDGLPEFIDAWGNPLRFYLWPTRLIRPDPTNRAPDRRLAGLFFSGLPAGEPGLDGAPGVAGVDDDGNGTTDDDSEFGWPGSDDPDPLYRDPDDQLGAFQGLANAMTLALVESFYHTPSTYHVPLIVSAGPDSVLGLREPNDDANLGHLARLEQTLEDDILNNGVDPGDTNLNDNITNRNGSN